jgi:pilus assembly protein CpaC
MLAEPNVMSTSGHAASFIDGGKIPVPVVESSLTPGAVSIQFYPYGIQLNFLPEVTPRGTIHLKVTPEVSAPDYSNAVSVAGTTVPGFTTRRVDTEVELEAGQSFVIAGLLDNQLTETLNKIPGLANLPILGKLFQSRAKTKSNSELLVIVTPEFVRPIPAGQRLPEIKLPGQFMEGNSSVPMRQPGMESTGPVPLHAPNASMPVEQLLQQMEKQKSNPSSQTPSQAPPTMQGPPATGAPPSGGNGPGSNPPGGSDK